MRLFLWAIPYLCIIPGLTIYYFIENYKIFNSKFFITIFLILFSFLLFNFIQLTPYQYTYLNLFAGKNEYKYKKFENDKNIKAKISLFISFSLFIYFLYNFLSITPYQYTYLNVFNGNKEKRYQKFENDYWGASIEELVKKSHFNENELIKLSTCGVNPKLAKKYLKKNGYINFVFVDAEKSDYLIMTNRTIFSENKISNCFDVYKGVDIFKVQRDKVSLSVIRKKI